MLRAPLQSSFALQPLKVSTHHAQPYIVFIFFARLCSLRLLLNLKSLHITRNLIESLYGLRTLAVPMQSKVRESLPIFCHPCSLHTSRQPKKSPPFHTTVCSLYSSRKALQSSYELKRKSLRLLLCACSLHRYKIPLQSPYIAPTLKVPPHHARLSVSIGSVYLCGLGVTFAPLRLALTIGERAVSGSI